jgi:rhamnosyltransferase
MEKDFKEPLIAMATYNGEKFIKEQLESILTQSYSNIELVVTDYNSPDDTISIINDYIKNNKRVKLF